MATARLGAIVVVWAAVVAFGARALAQPAEPQRSEAEAAAQAAFDDGMRLMKQGQFEEACQRIEQSLKLDPGMAAQFRLAECYEQAGRVASAWKNYNDVATAARAAGMAERERVAVERARELQPRMPTLTVAVPAEVASIAGVQVRRDGAPMVQALWDTPVPVDPGTIRIEVTAPGREPWSTEVAVREEGAAVRVEVPPFEGEPATDGGGDGGGGTSGQTIAGIVLAATGAAAMGAGVIIGVAAKPRYDESADHCVDDLCDAEGLEIRDEVRTQGNVATAVFVIGGAMLVGGVVLWLTAPAEPATAEGDDVAVRFGLTPGGAVLRGSF